MAESLHDVIRTGDVVVQDSAFPFAPPDWSKTGATAQARDEGLLPSDDLWEAVRALQEYYVRHREAVAINTRELHDALDEKFHNKGGIRYLYQLFPGGPVAQGCRLAGLKAPAGAVDRGFGSVV